MNAPALAAGVVVRHPLTDAGPWIIERGAANPIRVGKDAGALLSRVDGRRSPADLAASLGPPWTSDLVQRAVDQFTEVGVLADDAAPNHTVISERRVVFVPPATVRFRLIDAARLLDPLRSLLAILAKPVALGAALVLALGGLFALAWQPSALDKALGQPLPLASFGWIWLSLAATTVVHELAHGGTLTQLGGRPGRLGVMIFYLSPACFCEVTDGWRLPRPRQRVAVALAGVAVQTVVAGTASLVALGLPDGTLRSTLLGFSVICYLIGAFNLLPLVKLDGYLALMAHLDIPHLRDKAIRDARRWWTRWLFGATSERELPGRWWVVPYGIACALFPIVILAVAASRWTHVLLVAGVVGAGLAVLLLGFLTYWLAARTVAVLREARRTGATIVRIAIVSTVAIGIAVGLLVFIRVPYHIPAGYVVSEAGVQLVTTDTSYLRPGQSATLLQAGVAYNEPLGTAVIGAGQPGRELVPARALMPISSDLPVPAITLPLSEVNATSLSTAGTAEVDAGTLPLWSWLGRTLTGPLWKTLST